MTQDEKFAARVKSQDDGLYRVCVVVVGGRIIFWTAPELLGNPEGLNVEIPHDLSGQHKKEKVWYPTDTGSREAR